jgi:hypothetical protein
MNRTTFLGEKPINRIGFGAMQLAGPGVFGRAATRMRLRPSCGGPSNCARGWKPNLRSLRVERLDLVNLRLVEVVDVAGIQNGHSIVDRQDEETVRLAGARTVAQVADKHGATPAQIALAWLLGRYDRMLLVPGTSSIAHLEENMAAIEVELDDADLAALYRIE